MKVIDNFLPPPVFNSIQKVITGPEFPWFKSLSVSSLEADDGCYFYHHFYREDAPSSKFYSDLISRVLIHIQPKALIRVKANLYPPAPEVQPHGWHQDCDYPHKGALLFLNETDAPTEFQNGLVDSVPNRMVFFDPSQQHRSAAATTWRYTVNFNYF